MYSKFKTIDKWTTHWTMDALSTSLLSYDPSTKCGAVIIRPNNTIVSAGFNGFPKQMLDYLPDYADRETKYQKIIHAEMNALGFALEDISGCTMYCWPALTCERCAVHIIQRGITRVVGPLRDDRWSDSYNLAEEYYNEAKVEIYRLTRKQVKGMLDERTSVYQEL